ncbi:MAG: hypothetical protein HGA25_01030, partial [Clostridiales bacterium]|nr:hypothetical protein [Clostridiales bacterium]
NGIFSLFAIAGVILLSFLIPKNKTVNKILMVLFLIFCTGVSFWWVFTSHSFPKGDAAIMYSVAEQIINGINDTLKEGGYIYIYPQQLGLGALIELIFRLFGAGNETAFQCLNAALIPVMFYAGYRLTHEIFDNHRIDFYFMMLMSTCLPLFLYVPYMYGEISSTTFLFALALLVKKYSRNPRYWYLGLGMVLATLAVLVRKNSWIVIIAVLIVLCFHAIAQKRYGAIVFAILILVGIFGVDKAIEVTYENRTNCELEEGMPALLWVAMGIQDNWLGPGWYSDYNRVTFNEVGLDCDKANEVAMEFIQERIQAFQADPKMAYDFYKRKILTQWNEPTYEAFFHNNSFSEPPVGLVHDLFFDTLNAKLIDLMNRYQTLIYGSVLLFSIASFFKKRNLADYVLLIGIIGGFLFSLLWEAKSRYILPYFIFMLPYAAGGIGVISNILVTAFHKIRRKVS